MAAFGFCILILAFIGSFRSILTQMMSPEV